MPTFNNKDTDKKGRWKDKVYSKQIMAYVDQSLRPDEKSMYKVIFDELSRKFNITDLNELMLLDLAVNDYIRIKRMHLVLKDESDIINIKTRTGQTVRKAHEAGYLLNAIQTQFRQTFKELLLTPREALKKTIGEKPKDFTNAIEMMEGDYEEVEDNGNRKQSGVKSSKDKETKPGDTTRGSKREDRKDGKTTEDIKNGRTSKTTGEVWKAT